MAELTLTQKLRSAHVKRWQIVRVAREQNIAEHMYRVHLIASKVCKDLDLDPARTAMVKSWALMHDLPEVVTGDIATTTKIAMRKAVPTDDPLRHVELSLDDEYRETYLSLKENHPIVLDIVKLSDLIEAIEFVTTEGIGVRAFEVESELKSELKTQYSKCINDYEFIDWQKWLEVLKTIQSLFDFVNPIMR